MKAIEFARRHGFAGDRMPWFGVYLPMDDCGKREIIIASDYISETAIDIAFDEGMKMWPGAAFTIRWHNEARPCAGFIPPT